MAEYITEIGEFQKGSETVKVQVTEFKGKLYLNIRCFFPDEDDGHLIPTKKGIALSDLDKIDQAIKLLQKGRNVLASMLAKNAGQGQNVRSIGKKGK